MSELYECHNGKTIQSEELSEMMMKLLELDPYKSEVYTWDDIGMASLMADIYNQSIRYCPQSDRWYIWDGCWRKQGESGEVSDRLQTLLNLLLMYVKEVEPDEDEADEKEVEDHKKFDKYIRSLRKFNAMKNVLEVLKTMVRMNLKDMDTNPYLLNTPARAYDLKTGDIISDIRSFNVTKMTSCNLPDFLSTKCDRWEQFVDEITSHDKAKAAFLQRALGYSILGVNREECMFVAYGAKTRNGKGTLFSTIATVLGEDYADSAPTDLICEGRNGKQTDFNAPQPALAKLVGTRLVSMAESAKDVRLDAASMKTMTGRDTLVTRDLFESSFSFVPQFTLWLNTNHLPAVTDDTVFSSNRIWVIEFNEHFEGSNQDKDLKELFAKPENRPTILKWIYDGCQDYIAHGLNPPECVVKATAAYRQLHDRIGCFIEDRCEINDEAKVLRGNLYSTYSQWCLRGENRYKPMGSTSFYNEIAMRGFPVKRLEDGWYIHGITVKNTISTTEGKIKLV